MLEYIKGIQHEELFAFTLRRYNIGYSIISTLGQRGAQVWLLRPTHLSLRGVRRAQHAPLRGLQGARPANLPGLLKLGGDPGHHAESRYEGETRQDLGDTLTVHLESLQRPVALWTENSKRNKKHLCLQVLYEPAC